MTKLHCRQNSPTSVLNFHSLSPGTRGTSTSGISVRRKSAVGSRVEKFARIMHPVSRISPGLAVCPHVERFHGNDNGYRDLIAVTFLPRVRTWNTPRYLCLPNARAKRTHDRFHRSFHSTLGRIRLSSRFVSLCDDRQLRNEIILRVIARSRKASLYDRTK